jgi:hypothetical protein
MKRLENSHFMSVYEDTIDVKSTNKRQQTLFK